MKTNQVNSRAMDQAIASAKETMFEDVGGPFGAVILDSNHQVIAVSSNSVLSDHDPSAHAEINVIRAAGKILKTHDLSGCTIITTCYPCPMCLGAIIWANIKKVVYGCRIEDAEDIGFRDDYIYRYIRDGNQDHQILELSEEYRERCLSLFKEYKENNKTMY